MERTNKEVLKEMIRAGRGKIPAHKVIKGGQVVVADGEIVEFLPLPVGGIVISDAEPEEVRDQEQKIDQATRLCEPDNI